MVTIEYPAFETRMPGISAMVQLTKVLNAPGVAGNARLIAESQVLLLRLPFDAYGWFWARPTAVTVERDGTVTQRLPLSTFTRFTIPNRSHSPLMTDDPYPESPSTQAAEPLTVQFFDRLFGAARASAVYSEPVTVGAYTLITASEVIGGGGFGNGRGFGPAASPGVEPTRPAGAGGGGSGGGGGASGRPVAVIVVGPDGVQVKPIFDVTKLGLAALTTWTAMLVTILRMRRATTGR